MNHLKLDQSKVPELIEGLKELLAYYQQYRERLSIFLEEGEYENFREINLHFKSLYKNTSEDLKNIVSRIQVLNYTKTIELKRLPKFIERGTFSDARNIMLMAESIINDHKVLVSKMKSIIHEAELVNDKHTSRLISRISDYFEIQSWILKSWIDMYTEILSQRISLFKSDRRAKIYPYSPRFKRTDLFRYYDA